MSLEGYWIIRTHEAGNVGEKTKFWIPGARPSKSSRRVRSEIKKQEENNYSALKTCARLINANFGAGDWLIGYDYSPEGMEKILRLGRERGFAVDSEDEAVRLNAVYDAAEHELRLAMRRAKAWLKKNGGGELRCVAVTSDMDGDTGESVRVHHHLVVPHDCLDAFRSAWDGFGGVNWVPLKQQDDYMEVAAYLLRQVRHRPDAKKYISTRNLVRPQPRDRIAISGSSELRVPQGGRLLHRGEYRPGAPQYIRYVLPEERKRGVMRQ